MRLVNNLDLNFNQLVNALAHTLAADPSSPQEGQLWYNSTTKQLKYRTNTATIVLLDNFIPLTQKGAANGVATLDGAGKVPIGQLPDTVTGGLDYQGIWNASTNTPALSSGGAGRSKGDYFKVSVAGSTSLDGITDWKVGDWVVFNGTTWDKLDQTETVTSVAGKTGPVSLTAADVAGVLSASNNLAELTNVANARTSLGLGTAATRNAPVSGNASATEVVLGNDTRLTSQLQRFNANVGDGIATSFIVTHNFNSQDVVVSVRETVSPFAVVLADVEMTSVNTVTIRFSNPPTTNQFRVTVLG